MSDFTVDDITRISNDSNGNPRYVLHYLALASTYSEALYIAKQRGGRKFHNKQYGGGIAFQEYNVDDLVSWVQRVQDEVTDNA